MYGLEGKVALVTGAANGIGRRVATRLAEEGCDVCVVDLDLTLAEETAHQIEASGRRALALKVDVADWEASSAAVAKTVETLGRIDVLSNNAGIIAMGRIADMEPEVWRKVFRVNVDGTFHFCKAVTPHLVAQKSGRIINTASWFGKIAKSHYGAYSASKFAVIGLTQALAQEIANTGVTVNAVCPGTIVGTAMREEADRRSIEQGQLTAAQRASGIPLGRVGYPEDIARVVAFLASEESAYMTGQSINVTGGLWMH
jgi:acetoin reductase-like protein